MKIFRLLSLSFFICFIFIDSSFSAADPVVKDSIYKHARSGNKGAISNLKSRGFSIDTVDENGNTALCTSIIDKNRSAYNILKAMGADTNHSCVKRLAFKPGNSGSVDPNTWTTGDYVWAAAAVAVVGGTAAALAGGGGGGSSSSSGSGNGNNGNGNGGGGTDGDGEGNGGDDDAPDGAAFFETSEYMNGEFLDTIKASHAYARIYEVNNNVITNSLEKVKVGIIDTGISTNHAKFANTVISGYNYDYGPCRGGNTVNCWRYSTSPISGYPNVAYAYINGVLHLASIKEENFNIWAAKYPEDYKWEDSQDDINPVAGERHGTHVAGIIAAEKTNSIMHGVAFENVELDVVRWDFLSDLNTPVVKLIDDGVKVINLSLGAEADASLNASTVSGVPTILTGYLDMYRQASQNNVILVFSAGNEGYVQPSVLTGAPLMEEFKPGGLNSLENLLITVVALDSSGTNIADYSNRCGVTKNYCIAAPGSHILSTDIDEGYMYLSGTSMAAPVVTGSIALLMGAYPYMTPQQVVELIFETARDLGAAGIDDIYGNGALDLGAATSPQGLTRIASTNSVDGKSIRTDATSMYVPAVFQASVLKNMPKSIAILDKYNRPFSVSTLNFVRATNAGKQNFRNDVYAFSKHKPIKRTEEKNGMSFGFAPSSIRKSDYGFGLVDVAYKGESNSFRFFYAEDTKYNSDAYFDQSLFNPYLAMKQAYGMESGYRFNDRLNVQFGFSTGENGLYDGGRDYNDYDFDDRAYAFSNEVSYNLTKALKISALSGILYEDSAILGMNGSGAFNIGDSNTYYAGMSLSWRPVNKLTLSGVYYQGWTDAAKSSSSLMETSRLISDSFALDSRYELNKQDIFGLQISSPLRVYRGKALFDIPVGRDDYSNEVYRKEYSANMKPDSREYKFSLYHMREVNDNINFKTQFDIRLNPEHQKGADTDYRAMFGLNYSF